MSGDTRSGKPVDGRVMGIDFGSKRIGISISDPTCTIAQGLLVLENDQKIFENIEKICLQYGVKLILVGLPLKLNGGHSSKTDEVLKFIGELKSRLNVEVITWG